MQDFRFGFTALGSLLLECVNASASNLPPHFVRLADVAPLIRQEIRYAGSDNFTGRPVPGYAAAECWLRKEAAFALATAQTEALKQGLKLVVYDCYRPQRATNAFVKWANDDTDQLAKDRFFQQLRSVRFFLRATSAVDPHTQQGSLSISQSKDSTSVRHSIFLIRVRQPTASS